MAQTVIRGTQILNNTVQRQDLDTSTVGQAVVTKLVQGSGITLSSTGADSGTGDVTVSSPDVVSTDAGNIATLGTDSHILVPQSQIWSVRLRSFNAIGGSNPTFEVDQTNVGALVTNPGNYTRVADRWWNEKFGSIGWSFQRMSGYAMGSANQVVVPGTTFIINPGFLRLTLLTQQTTLAATDRFQLYTPVEGPYFRELQGGIHSLSILARASVAQKFSLAINDPAGSNSLVQLCTLSPNVWTLIALPNLPVFPNAGNFSSSPGIQGYTLYITLAAGSSYLGSAGTWLTGGVRGASGMDNWGSFAVNSTFDIAFVQHEPNSQCTTPIDCPFGQNYDGDFGCLRYFTKSYDYGVALGTAGSVAGYAPFTIAQNLPNWAYGGASFPKRLARAQSIQYWSKAGVANAATAVSSGDLAVTGVSFSARAVDAISFGGNRTTGETWQMHYAVDSGW